MYISLMVPFILQPSNSKQALCLFEEEEEIRGGGRGPGAGFSNHNMFFTFGLHFITC